MKRIGSLGANAWILAQIPPWWAHPGAGKDFRHRCTRKDGESARLVCLPVELKNHQLRAPGLVRFHRASRGNSWARGSIRPPAQSLVPQVISLRLHAYSAP
jgi:hypothetical protein